jgi:5-methyltetrahydrofolate--homocysteine methyltransferase
VRSSRAPPRHRAKEDGRPRFVAGASGPTNRTASISPDVQSRLPRHHVRRLRSAYGEQARG